MRTNQRFFSFREVLLAPDLISLCSQPEGEVWIKWLEDNVVYVMFMMFKSVPESTNL